MSEDLYTSWLKVPAGPRPPDHYALLGVPRFCEDAQQIETAAQKQLDVLDRHSLHNDLPKREACHQMMNEVARARVVLTTPAKRTAYDQTLDPSRIAPQPKVAVRQVETPAVAPIPIPVPVPAPVPAIPRVAPRAAPVVERPRIEPRPKPPKKPSPFLAKLKKDPVMWITPVAVTVLIAGGIFYGVHQSHTAEPTKVVIANPGIPSPSPKATPAPVVPAVSVPPITPVTPTPPVRPAVDPTPRPPTPVPVPVNVTPPPLTPAVVVKPVKPAMSVASGLPGKPVPDADAQFKAAKLVDQIFADDLSGAGTAQAKTDLARKMLVLAGRLNDDANGQYILLTRAGDLAAQAGDINTAISAIDSAAKEFQIDGLHVKARALASVAKIINGAQDEPSLMRQTDAVIDEAMKTDRYDIASYSIDVARFAAETLNDPAWLDKADRQKKQIKAIEDEFAGVKDAIATLAKNPADATANSKVGQFRCFVKGDWEAGLPLLAAGSDPQFKLLAATELSHPTDYGKIVELADEWWNLAGTTPSIKQRNLMSHAAKLYAGVVSGLQGVVKPRVQKRIDEAEHNAG